MCTEGLPENDILGHGFHCKAVGCIYVNPSIVNKRMVILTMAQLFSLDVSVRLMLHVQATK